MTERDPGIDPVTGRRPGETYFDPKLGRIVSVPMRRNRRDEPKRRRTETVRTPRPSSP